MTTRDEVETLRRALDVAKAALLEISTPDVEIYRDGDPGFDNWFDELETARDALAQIAQIEAAAPAAPESPADDPFAMQQMVFYIAWDRVLGTLENYPLKLRGARGLEDDVPALKYYIRLLQKQAGDQVSQAQFDALYSQAAHIVRGYAEKVTEYAQNTRRSGE